MNELMIIPETKKVAGDVASSLLATVYTLTHDHTARVALRKKTEKTALVFLLGFLFGVVWLRAVDVPEVEQTGRAIHVVEEGAAPTMGAGDPLISHGGAVTASPQGEAKEREEAEEIAKLLYGIRKNSERDLRAVCWVVFNRVESPLYPDSIEEVVNQPGQWVSYYPENPATEELTALAQEELEKWEAKEGRLLSRDTLWFNWSKDAITFREEF